MVRDPDVIEYQKYALDFTFEVLFKVLGLEHEIAAADVDLERRLVRFVFNGGADGIPVPEGQCLPSKTIGMPDLVNRRDFKPPVWDEYTDVK